MTGLVDTFQDPCFDEGVISLADSNYFPGFVLLYESIQLSYPVPVTCYDGGLTDEQKQWADENLLNCTISPLPDTEEIRTVRARLVGIVDNDNGESLLWICPFLIASSPYQRVLWLDADLIVVKDIAKLFEFIDQGPVFIQENKDASFIVNKPELYEEIQLGEGDDQEQLIINSGVSGWDRVRDAHLIDNYMASVIEVCRSEKILKSVNLYDRSFLNSAVKKCALQNGVLQDVDGYQHDKQDTQEKVFKLEENLNNQLIKYFPDTKIVHWKGCRRIEKSFNQSGSEAAVLDAVLRRLPGPRYEWIAKQEKPGLKLICHMSSTTAPALISHFIRHYKNAGVDKFLIIFHEADGHAFRAKNILKSHNIDPVMIVEDYSASIKARRVEKIKARYVSPDDWVIYADVDEFQVYPEKLSGLLRKCDRMGYDALPGVFVDRVAIKGELKEVTESPSVWEQYPYRANVTSELSGGWTRKICVARASVPLNYTGAHTRLYDCGVHREYKTTYLDCRNWPEKTEIHHFKWDATLIPRLQNKLNGLAGDRDAIDGESFIQEYFHLYQHILDNNRISIAGLQYIGIPYSLVDAKKN